MLYVQSAYIQANMQDREGKADHDCEQTPKKGADFVGSLFTCSAPQPNVRAGARSHVPPIIPRMT
jgi:hypothetical protein